MSAFIPFCESDEQFTWHDWSLTADPEYFPWPGDHLNDGVSTPVRDAILNEVAQCDRERIGVNGCCKIGILDNFQCYTRHRVISALKIANDKLDHGREIQADFGASETRVETSQLQQLFRQVGELPKCALDLF